MSESYESLVSKLMQNLSGTNAYWNQAKDDLKAIITQVGTPPSFRLCHVLNSIGQNFMISLTIPLNCHILHSVKMSSIILICLIVVFTEGTEQFVKHWLKNTRGVTWHWFRYECAVQRGYIHCHGIAKLESEAGLCDLSQTALKVFLQIMLRTDSSPELLSEKEEKIKKGKEAETIICNYVDYLKSTQNPTDPDETSWVKPVNHPCKLRFQDIQNDWDTDYENPVNLVQRHTNCSTAHCL